MKFVNREYGFEGRPPFVKEFSDVRTEGVDAGDIALPAGPFVALGSFARKPNAIVIVGDNGSLWELRFSYFKNGKWVDSEAFSEADRRRGRETVNEIIDDFMEAKEHLNTVCKLAKRMNSKNVPVVKEIIDAYLDFFVKADAICMTVARYARNINREAEKALGHNSSWKQANENKNTYWSMKHKPEFN